MDDELSPSRAMGRLFAIFGLSAVLLASIGVFGVMSYSVARRTRELGIRMALGADGRRVLVSVLRRGLAVSGLGIALGSLLAPLLSRLLAGLLYGVAPFDPATYGVLAAFMLAVAGTAAYLPARRATRVNPIVVLNDE